MDIKATITELVKKIKGDKNLLANFKKDPVKTVEGLIGVNLPDDQVQGIVKKVQDQLSGKTEEASDGISSVVDKIKGLFGK